MRRFHLGSLRVRLIVLVLIAVIPAFGLILYTGIEQRAQASRGAQERGLQLARVAATNQETMVEAARQLMLALTQLPEVRGQDAAACTARFGDILKQYQRYVNIIAVEADGDVYCSAVPRTGKAPNIADRVWFQRTIDVKGFAVGDYEFGSITGKAEVHVAQPVMAGPDQLQGVVSIGLDLAWLGELAGQVNLPEGSSLSVIDGKGTVLARQPDGQKWVGQSLIGSPVFDAILEKKGQGTADIFDQEEMFYAFTPLYTGQQARGIYLTIGIPSSVVFAEANQALSRNLALLGIVGLIAMASAWFFSNLFFLRHVKALVGATRRLAAGDLNARTGLGQGVGELSQLAYTFDQMVVSLGARQDELRNYQAHLEELVDERTAELAEVTRQALEARAASDAATRAKSEFLANMSHELRTPMNAIIGYSEMLIEEASDAGEQGMVSDLEKVRGAGKHLLQLINDILDLSKIEADKLELHLETFDILPAVQDVLATVEPLVAKNANKMELALSEDLGSMRADMTRVRQVLFNLLSNACKFTEGGTIYLNGDREQVDGKEWIVFSVRDTGIGMTAEQMGRLFKSFSQADTSTTRKYGGTGLGLAISKRFCEMMGGSISVESEPSVGTAFTVRLPAQVVVPSQEPLQTVVEPRTPQPGGSATVLIIDDDPTVHDLLGRFLTKEGFRVVLASGGEQGLRLARQLHPDVITLDVLMPGMDGWAVLAALKADPDLADIPAIMLTIVEERNLAFALGASDFLTKPPDRDRLVNAIRKYLNGRESDPILVVEDDADTRELLRRMLQTEGWAVSQAENGRIALDSVELARPRLIILDLMMPEMDGFEFLTELRKRDEWRNIPILVVTAKDLTDADRQSLNSNVVKILQKGSLAKEDLLKEVADLVRKTVLDKGARGEEAIDAKDSVR